MLPGGADERPRRSAGSVVRIMPYHRVGRTHAEHVASLEFSEK